MKKIRCAIYTRKSAEEGLEQEFNSLDAQREACAAYVARESHEADIEECRLYRDYLRCGRHAGKRLAIGVQEPSPHPRRRADSKNYVCAAAASFPATSPRKHFADDHRDHRPHGYGCVALLHGPEQIADLPVPVAESPGAVRIGHPERSHLVEYLAPNSVFNSLPRQRSSPHLRPDDRLVTIDRVLHHASLGVA